MKYLIKIKNGRMHLFKENGLINEDLGELRQTTFGKLVTHNLFRPNYELEDVSVLFGKGEKYKFSGKGIKGTLVREWGNLYKYIED